MSEIFQIQAVLTRYKSKLNKSIEFTFDSQENMSPEILSTFLNLHDKLGYLNFAVRKIEAADIARLPEPNADEYVQGKTQAQRLRAVIYILWEQKGKKGNPDDHYKKTMENIISQLKEKLE